MAALWTNDKEEELVAMMEGKPELFDNTEMNFTNKTAKMNAWLELSEHFQISEKELRKKWDSLRTQYSRYTKMMYASDGRFTPRQQWIIQRLKFLDPHIKRRSNYCNDLDYEVMVVENGCEDSSPAQVDVEIEADSINKLELNLEASRLSKRPFQDDDLDSARSCGAKKPCSEKTIPQTFPKKRQCTEDNEDEESDSASLRGMVCSTMEEKKDCWDGFSVYVTSCLSNLTSSRSRSRAQEDVCATLQRHMERDGEKDEDGARDRNETCTRTCSTCCGSRRNKNGGRALRPAMPNTYVHDDLEPFFKSMSIIMKRLPEGERSEVKFRIHELVYKAEMKHLNKQTSEQTNVLSCTTL